MMRERLYIDGIDVYAEYGIYVISGGWNELLAYPPLKSPKTYTFAEEDGVEVDLTEPRLNTREVTVKFALGGIGKDYFGLIELLSDKAYHVFDCRSIGRKFKLRMTSQPSNDIAKLLGFASFKFADDFPLADYEYLSPVGSPEVSRDYLIGNIDPDTGEPTDMLPFTEYGCRVLSGAYSELTKIPNVRKNLTVDVASQSGVQYTDTHVVYDAKEVKLTLLLRADDLATAWRNYDALLHNLIQPEERMLYVESLDKYFPCYYKKCSVSEFFPDNGKIWLRFSLTLALTRDFRIEGEYCLLAAEDGSFVVTEEATPRKIEIFPAQRIAYLIAEDGRYVVSEEDDLIFIHNKP